MVKASLLACAVYGYLCVLNTLASLLAYVGQKIAKCPRFKTYLCNHHSPKPGHIPDYGVLGVIATEPLS